MNEQQQMKIRALMAKGVKIHNPDSLEIGNDVDVDRISGSRVEIHAGCRLFGASLFICAGVVIGFEGPATVQDCYIGPDVELKGGFFKEAVFLEKSSMGPGAHVRGGTICEEASSGAHTVALKQTILFPFVTLGSLINFCDCFMSGGTSRRNHSEVGSSFIHFNYTPNQDKATASLIGDVPRGVMLNQPPIFLGGQGGIVGPCRLAYGTVLAAGGICRKDQLEPGRLVIPGSSRPANLPFVPGGYRNVQRTVRNNIIYLANLAALEQWYAWVRYQFISEQFPAPLHTGLLATLKGAIAERIHRICQLDENMNKFEIRRQHSDEAEEGPQPLSRQKACLAGVDQIADRLKELPAAGDSFPKDAFLEKITAGIQRHGKDYLSVIQGLAAEDAELGTRWLQEIVDHITENILNNIHYTK